MIGRPGLGAHDLPSVKLKLHICGILFRRRENSGESLVLRGRDKRIRRRCRNTFTAAVPTEENAAFRRRRG